MAHAAAAEAVVVLLCVFLHATQFKGKRMQCALLPTGLKGNAIGINISGHSGSSAKGWDRGTNKKRKKARQR